MASFDSVSTTSGQYCAFSARHGMYFPGSCFDGLPVSSSSMRCVEIQVYTAFLESLRHLEAFRNHRTLANKNRFDHQLLLLAQKGHALSSKFDEAVARRRQRVLKYYVAPPIDPSTH